MKKFYLRILHTANLKRNGIAMMLGLCVFLMGMRPGRSDAQTISVTNVTTTPVCAGSDVTITFDVTNGATLSDLYTNSTIYQVFISNSAGTGFIASGSTFTVPFAYSPTPLLSTTGLTHIFTIPIGLPTGSGYKFPLVLLLHHLMRVAEVMPQRHLQSMRK
jgi:hypothetical protein